MLLDYLTDLGSFSYVVTKAPTQTNGSHSMAAATLTHVEFLGHEHLIDEAMRRGVVQFCLTSADDHHPACNVNLRYQLNPKSRLGSSGYRTY